VGERQITPLQVALVLWHAGCESVGTIWKKSAVRMPGKAGLNMPCNGPKRQYKTESRVEGVASHLKPQLKVTGTTREGENSYPPTSLR